MKVELGCNCDCWNEPAIRSFAQDITEQEATARQADLNVQEGKVACESPQYGGSVCGAYVVYSTVEFKGLRPAYDSSVVLATVIPGFEEDKPISNSEHFEDAVDKKRRPDQGLK